MQHFLTTMSIVDNKKHRYLTSEWGNSKSLKGVSGESVSLACIHEVCKEFPACWHFKEGHAKPLGNSVQCTAGGHTPSETLDITLCLSHVDLSSTSKGNSKVSLNISGEQGCAGQRSHISTSPCLSWPHILQGLQNNCQAAEWGKGLLRSIVDTNLQESPQVKIITIHTSRAGTAA